MTASLADSESVRLDDDGNWQPRSCDATTELRILLPEMSTRLGGPITRVSLNIDAWDGDQPRRMRVDDRVVRLGWFHTMDPATVTIARGSGPRVTLHVVQP